MRKSYLNNLILSAMFVAMIAVGAFITIHIPVVPLSLQDMFVLLAGVLLGAKWGCVSVCVYLAMGLAGLPIFTQGGGIGYFLRPTFGFLLGYIPAVYLVGSIANKVERPGFRRIFLACLCGIAVIYFFGTVYLFALNRFYLGNTIAFWPMILACDIQPLPGDLIKCVVAALIGKRMIPLIRNGAIS